MAGRPKKRARSPLRTPSARVPEPGTARPATPIAGSPADVVVREVRDIVTHLAEVERLTHIGSWEWDIVHDVVTWSAELYRLIGADPERVRRTRDGVLELIHPDDRAFVRETIERACHDHTPYLCEHRIVRPADGVVRMWESRGTVLCDAAERPIKLFGTAQDITERRQVQEALAHYVALVVSSDHAIVTNTLDGAILSWNPGAERLYGYRAAEMEGQPISILVPPDRQEELPEILARVRRGEHVEHLETVRLRRDGSRVYVSVSVSPIKAPGGTVIGASTIARDVTEQRRAAEALARSRAQLRAFAGQLRSARETERTHIAREIHDELGQALTALKMDLFSLKNSVPEPLRGPLLPKTDQMATLIDDMVDRVRTLAQELRPAVLDSLGLSAAVEWAVQQFAHRTGIACTLDLPPEPVALDSGRATDIFRILQEALTNVARHAGATRVSVHLRMTPLEVVLEVHDDGRGITDREVENSWAFGLMGMRERALPWGGEVGVQAAPQGGTSVTVCMPLGHGRPGAAA
jgi:PAS domain S-box-containing protein